jgi:DNA-directed RNA polymerase specialized sigma24 family protein
MRAQPDQTSQTVGAQQLREIRVSLLASARGGNASVPPRDAEDVVQDALLRFVREKPRPAAPAPRVRAHRALKDERAGYYRKRSGRPEVLSAEPVALLAGGREPDALFAQAAVAIEQIAGADARALVELRGQRYSYEDCALELGWAPERVDAARKQIERHRKQIARALDIHMKEVQDGS